MVTVHELSRQIADRLSALGPTKAVATVSLFEDTIRISRPDGKTVAALRISLEGMKEMRMASEVEFLADSDYLHIAAALAKC